MDKIELPEPEYYTVSMLAARWGCGIYDVLHYGRTGQLEIYVMSYGWMLEEGVWEKDGDDVSSAPTGQRWSRNEIFQLFNFAIGEIIKKQKILNPSFVYEDGKYLGISNRLHDNISYAAIEIYISDLIIPLQSKSKFEGLIQKNDKTIEVGEYITPYIELMFKAIKENNISKENQGKVEDLRNWFVSQKIGGENISETAAKNMATFIRLPESKKGGNKPFKKG